MDQSGCLFLLIVWVANNKSMIFGLAGRKGLVSEQVLRSDEEPRFDPVVEGPRS